MQWRDEGLIHKVIPVDNSVILEKIRDKGLWQGVFNKVADCVEIKILRVDLHATDATPARWRSDAGSLPLDGARTAASSPRNL